MNPLRFAASILAILPAFWVAPLSAQEHGELGRMWTFENAPIEYLQAVYGFSPTQSWLDTTRLAALRFGNGCSSSFVSPRGLILTNHHCVRDYVAKVSPAGQDWVKDGFIARVLAEEVRIPGLTVQQLISMEDITVAMNHGVEDADSDVVVDQKRRDNEKAITERAKKETPEFTAQVVKLYQGAMFQLYRYRVWDDIRLCAAPHLQTAHFGGDPDNFTYPRFAIDFALCRAYVDGMPADTSAHYFKWSAEGPKDGDTVFVVGNPGTTDRSRTVAQLEYLRDVAFPIRMESIDRRIEILQDHARTGPEEEKAVRTETLGLQNAQKAYRGYLGGLKDASLMKQKHEAEAAFRKRVEADAALCQKFGDAWAKLGVVCREKKDLEPRLRFETSQGWKLLQVGVHVVRASDPEIPDDQRETSRKTALELDAAEPEYEHLSYADQLTRASKWVGKDDPFIAALLKDRRPKEAMAALAEGTQLGSKDFVKGLLEGGAEAVKKCDDPVINVAKTLVPLLKQNQARFTALTAEENVHSARIGQALFAVYGRKIAPDATFTLRLADGVVKGFPCNGTIACWRTSFYGLYARNCEFEGRYPFDLPPAWLDRRDHIDLTKSVNFVSTNDIIGGNSGSPVINVKQEIVGLVFDGNIESLANRFVFKDDIPRTVSVHSDAIIEALTKVYDAPRLADELLSRTNR
jgi:hypothetical protein